MIQTIVFATDLCVFTPYVVNHVLELAERLQAKVVVVHAIEPLGTLGAAMVKNYLPESEDLQSQDARTMEVISSLRERIIDIIADEFLDADAQYSQNTEVVVVPGKPADVILEVAEARDANLIMVGTHSPDFVHGYSLGSVANRVLQLSKVPVYTVPMLPKAHNSSGLSQAGGGI
ncbi:universal stress protein [Aurantivibrio plasticivorans]